MSTPLSTENTATENTATAKPATTAIGAKLVQLCNEGRSEEAVTLLYSDHIVSIEAEGTDAMPARMEGIEAIHQKGRWWEDNHDVHGLVAEGPFVGNREDQFVVRFAIDVTPKGGERALMTEVGVYQVRNDKVIQEEFLYLS